MFFDSVCMDVNDILTSTILYLDKPIKLGSKMFSSSYQLFIYYIARE
jgi:hypothetical protein